MPNLKKPLTQLDFNDLFIGNTSDGKEINLADKSLLVNGLLVVGTKNSGKSSLIPNFFIQMINTPYDDESGKRVSPVSNAGVTVITSKRNQVYTLYAIAKKNHRTLTRLLKPSANFKLKNELLGLNEYDYNKINEFVDYTKAINDKEIILIDMENNAYEDAARRAVGMLLLQLQISMHNTAATGCRRHYLIIDDAYQYMPYLEYILRYGPDYNIIPVLLVDSREQLDSYKSIVDTNIQNILLMGNVSFDDAKHYAEQFFLDSPKELIGHSRDDLFCSFYDENMRLTQQRCTLSDEFFDEHEQELMATNAAKYRKALDKIGTDDEYVSDILKAYAYYVVSKQHTYNTGTSFDSLKRVGKEEDKKKSTEVEKKTNTSISETEIVKPVEIPNKLDKSSDDNDEQVALLPNIRQKPIAKEDLAKTNNIASIDRHEAAGIRALLGKAVTTAPPRIQKRLEEQGMPVEKLKKNPQDNLITAMKICDKNSVFSHFELLPSNNINNAGGNNKKTKQNQPTNNKKKKKKKKSKKKPQSVELTKEKSHESQKNVAEKSNEDVKTSSDNATKSVKTVKSTNKANNSVTADTDKAKKVDTNKDDTTLKNTTDVVVHPTETPATDNVEKQKTNVEDSQQPEIVDANSFSNEFPDYDENSNQIDDIDNEFANNQSMLSAYDDDDDDIEGAINMIFAPPEILDADIETQDNMDEDTSSINDKDKQEDNDSQIIYSNEKMDIFAPASDSQKLGLNANLANLSNIPKSSGESFNSYKKSFAEMINYEGSKTSFFNSRKAAELLKKNFT